MTIHVQAVYLAQNATISPTDTYFMISCLNGGSIVPTPGRHTPPPPRGRVDLQQGSLAPLASS